MNCEDACNQIGTVNFPERTVTRKINTTKVSMFELFGRAAQMFVDCRFVKQLTEYMLGGRTISNGFKVAFSKLCSENCNSL